MCAAPVPCESSEALLTANDCRKKQFCFFFGLLFCISIKQKQKLSYISINCLSGFMIARLVYFFSTTRRAQRRARFICSPAESLFVRCLQTLCDCVTWIMCLSGISQYILQFYVYKNSKSNNVLCFKKILRRTLSIWFWGEVGYGK